MYSIVIFEGAISLLIVAWIAVLEELALVSRTLKKLRILTMLYKINVHDWKTLVNDNRSNIDDLRLVIEHEENYAGRSRVLYELSKIRRKNK
jgi:hypothetical protein